MRNFAERILKFLDSGLSVFDISQHFGGMDKLMNVVSEYPNLKKILLEKIGGNVVYYITSPTHGFRHISIPFYVEEIEDLSDDIGMDHFNLLIDINIPEISDEIEMSKIATYLDDFLQSMGDESVVLNDRSNFGRFFLPVLYKINGKIFSNLPHTDFMDESEFVNLVPEKYFID